MCRASEAMGNQCGRGRALSEGEHRLTRPHKEKALSDLFRLTYMAG